MKASTATPVSSFLMKVLNRQAPVMVPVVSTYMRPVELRRYVRNLRETRQYHFTRDFLY